MSTVTSQPCASRTLSRGHCNASISGAREPLEPNAANPSIMEPSYPTHDLDFAQSMSDMNRESSIIHTEHPSTDPTFYDQPFSPSTLVDNFLTPEYSSENQYSDPSVPTTPGWQEDWWATDTSIVPMESTVPFHDGLTQYKSLSMINDVPVANFYQESVAKSGPPPSHQQSQLMSPQLTSTPSPSGHSTPGFAMGATSAPIHLAAEPNRPSNKSRSAGLRLNPGDIPAEPGSGGISLQASPSEPVNMAPSPILMVSTYNRGDSPARSGIRLARSSSKRSRASRSSNYLAPANNYSSEDEEESEQDHVQNATPQVARSADGSWLPVGTSGQGGLDPEARGDTYVPSLKEIEEKRQLDEKFAEVESWLDKSEAGSELGDEAAAIAQPRRRTLTKPKPRSHSTGARPNTLQLVAMDDSGIPGPGALLDEDSETAYTDDSASRISENDIPTSPAADADIHSREIDQGYFPPVEAIPPEHGEPLPRQFIRGQPWQDTVKGPTLHHLARQPQTANAAMYRYDLLAAAFDSASRAATWGTRRLSETDVQSIISGERVGRLNLAQRTRERGNSFVKQAVKLIPRRSSSNHKDRDIDAAQEGPYTDSAQLKRTDTLSSLNPLQRIPSIGKGPKSPPLNTGSALVAMTGQITAVGRSTSADPDTATLSPNRWKSLRRQRSKSEILRRKSSTRSTPGLAELMTNHGGPPVPVLVSPMQERRSTEQRAPGPTADDEGGNEGVDEDVPNDAGVKIDLKVKMDNIVPNLDGFRSHARQLNPRLEPFLTERIVLEQVRRYKKLVENKVKHTHAVQNLKQCSSDSFCFALGGEAKDLPPRTSIKDPEATGAQFQVSGSGDSDAEANTFAEGIVNAALFPVGIPLPPVKKLPAEFECSLCFKVKKFQKPSDWTKHVHEDVQPFTCTFPDCSEVRSFKRKADWVRHENERHRHLEWWQCNMPECSHICYRKDNFVQHLVREHKRREPKGKSRGSTSSKSRPEVDSMAARQARLQDEEAKEVWKLVDTCHFETEKKAKDEVCKFCGNVCNSWKQLTVHLAKHMEQIALPVLELVKLREVAADTIVSPIERSSRQQVVPTSTHPEGNPPTASNGPLSCGAKVTQRSGLQVTQSPGNFNQDSHYTHSMQNSPSFSHTPTSAYDAQIAMQPLDMVQFSQTHNLPADMSYGPYRNVRQPLPLLPTSAPGAVATTYPPLFNNARRSPPHHLLPNGAHTHPGLVPIDTIYNGQSSQQQPIYSSPTDGGPYTAHYALNVDAMQNSYAASTMAYSQGQMSAGMSVPQDVIYDTRPSPSFLANQANGQTYPYTPQ